MIEQLKARGYRSDPVKVWKAEMSDEGEEGEEEEAESRDKGQPDYNYLLSMQLWSLTREKKEELLKNRDKKVSCVCMPASLVSELSYYQMHCRLRNYVY